MNRLVWASVGLVALTLGELITLYQVLFDVWMTAYPFANTKEWQTRLYIRLITAIAIGVCWGLLAGWLYRQHRYRIANQAGRSTAK